MRTALIAILGLLTTACVTARAPAPDPATRNAGIAFQKLTATYRNIARSAEEISARRVGLEELPKTLTTMCHLRCEAQYYRCVIASVPGIEIPGLNERAPKEFPFEIPDCSDPECSSTPVSEPAGHGCSAARDLCDKRCDCREIL